MKLGWKFERRKVTDQMPEKLVPMVSANVTTKIHAHQEQLDLQVNQEQKVNQEHQANLDPKENQELVADLMFPPVSLAENVHLDLQGQKDPQDLQAKEGTKANQATTAHKAKMEVSDQLDHPDRPEKQEKMVNQAQQAHQAKMVLLEPKENRVKPVHQVTMDQQDLKDHLVPMAKPAHQVQAAHQAQQAKTAAQVQKDQRAKQDQQVVQERTLNTVLAHAEASIIHKLYPTVFFIDHNYSQLLHHKFQFFIIVYILYLKKC
jgi:hypothetical protein